MVSVRSRRRRPLYEHIPLRWQRRLAGVAATLGALATGAVAAQQSELPPPPQAASDEEDVVPMCHNDLRLSGAVYNPRRPARSFAVVQLKEGQPGFVYRVGGWIGHYQLLAIEPRGVLLRDGEAECWLQLRGAPADTRRPKAKPRSKKKKRSARKAKKTSSVTVIGGSKK